MVGESGMMAFARRRRLAKAEVVEKSREAVRHNDDDTTTTLQYCYFSTISTVFHMHACILKTYCGIGKSGKISEF
jgi:hypothetical protein